MHVAFRETPERAHEPTGDTRGTLAGGEANDLAVTVATKNWGTALRGVQHRRTLSWMSSIKSDSGRGGICESVLSCTSCHNGPERSILPREISTIFSLTASQLIASSRRRSEGRCLGSYSPIHSGIAEQKMNLALRL